MAGISSKALNSIVQNKRGYNGNEIQNKEFSDGSGLEFYDFNARTYDQQIGRFHQVDPLVEDDQEDLSPYHFSFNNPIRYSDADGKAPEDIIIRGKNNSSVTLQTDLIDIDVNASGLGIDFGGNHTLNGEDVLSAGLDIVGVVDPTGVADGINAGLQAKNGDWLGAGISMLGIIPYVGDVAKVGKIGKDIKIISKAIEEVKSAGNALKEAKSAKQLLKEGRAGKQERLLELMKDPKLGKADKGWLKQEKNAVDAGKRSTMRNPPGKDLAHKRGKEAAKGYSYKHSNLQNRDLHKRQHKYDNNGKKNRENPN